MNARFDLWQKEREQAEDFGVLKALKSECAKGPTLKMWLPKATNPFSNYRYFSVEKRDKALQAAIEDQKAIKAMKEERNQARKGTPEKIDSVKLGDIFHFSWGYEQTNVDFYQVIEKSGRMLTLREIGQKSTDRETGNSMADYRVAVKDAFLPDKKPIKKLLQFSGNTPYIRIESFGWCSLWDGDPTYCSWYA